MNSGDMDTILKGFGDIISNIKSSLGGLFQPDKKGGKIQQLKDVLSGAAHIAMGKLLDKIGRPGIPMMNSLLSGEPTGFWHVTIGNPMNPIMCIGNLLITGVDVNFPTDNLSYFEFPTKLSVVIKLKPGMPKDRAGVEMMFNAGKSRLYFAPETIKVEKSNNLSRTARKFYGFDNAAVKRLTEVAYDFMPCLTSKVEQSGKDAAKYFKTFGEVLIENVTTPINNTLNPSPISDTTSNSTSNTVSENSEASLT